MTVDFDDYKHEMDMNLGFQDNHGRIWVRCKLGEPTECVWNFGDKKENCRLKYPSDKNQIRLKL